MPLNIGGGFPPFADDDNPFSNSDSWVVDGPNEYKCAYYSVIYIPGTTERYPDQWIGEVYSDPERSDLLYFAQNQTSGSSMTELLKKWIDQYCDDSIVDPPAIGSIDLISQDYDSYRNQYVDCVDVAIPLVDMDFVQTSNANLNRTFVTDSTQADVLVIGPLPEGVKIPVSVSIEAIDESFPAATRERDYKESHNVYLEGGDSLEASSNGVSISLSIIRNGSEIVDPFSVSNLATKYTKSGVRIKAGQIQICQIPSPTVDPVDDEDQDQDQDLDLSDDPGLLDSDTMFVILGILVLFVIGGWIISTTVEGGD